MKTLIVYYSFTQNNEALAKVIQSRLDCEMLKIETVRKRSSFSIILDAVFGRRPAIRKFNQTLMDYDQFVIVGPIWLGKIAGPLKTFLREAKHYLKNYSFISVCGGLAGQKQKIENELTALIGVPPRNVYELWVSEIVGEHVTKDAKNISAYRIGSSDLEKFKTKIDAFCDAIIGETVNQ